MRFLCWDVAGAPNCCDSCHQDDNEYGYQMCEVNPYGYREDDDWYYVCCALTERVHEIVEEKRK